MTENRVIGLNSRLPWSLPDDWSRLKRMVREKDIVMGRKTVESHEAFLSKGKNIVFSRSIDRMEGCTVVQDIDALMRTQERDLYILGGSDIYQLFLPYATHLFLTIIHTSLHGDTYFPEYPLEEWQLVNQEDKYKDDRHDYDFSYMDYTRIQ